jgi:hypothetical protein
MKISLSQGKIQMYNSSNEVLKSLIGVTMIQPSSYGSSDPFIVVYEKNGTFHLYYSSVDEISIDGGVSYNPKTTFSDLVNSVDSIVVQAASGGGGGVGGGDASAANQALQTSILQNPPSGVRRVSKDSVSGSIAAANTSEQIIAANTGRNGIEIQNKELADSMTIKVGGTATATDDYIIEPGGWYYNPVGLVSTKAIHAFSAKAGHKFSYTEY